MTMFPAPIPGPALSDVESSGSGVTLFRMDGEGRLVDEVPCQGCGYLLRGLGLEDTCPECGKPVSQSARDDLLLFSDPFWLSTLRRGATLSLWTIAASLAYGLVVGLLDGLLGARPGGPGTSAFTLLAILGGAILLTMNTLAVFWLSAREPGCDPKRKGETARRWVRITVVIGIALTIIGWVFMVSASAGGGFAASAGQGMLELLNNLVGMVSLVAVLLYTHQVLRRWTDVRLAKSFRTIAWGLVAGTVLITIASVLQIVNVNTTFAQATGQGQTTITGPVGTTVPATTAAPGAPGGTPFKAEQVANGFDPHQPASQAVVKNVQQAAQPDGSTIVTTTYDDGVKEVRTTASPSAGGLQDLNVTLPDGTSIVWHQLPGGDEMTFIMAADGSTGNISKNTSGTTTSFSQGSVGFAQPRFMAFMIALAVFQMIGGLLSVGLFIWAIVAVFKYRNRLRDLIAAAYARTATPASASADRSCT